MKNILYTLPFVVSCATTQQYVKRQEQKQQRTEQHITSELERITADGNFDLIAAYVHREIDQHPDEHMNELYDGAEVALRHAPNGVYQLAIDQYEEDVREYFESRIYVMEHMQKRGGFSYTYDLNYDE